MIRRSLGAALLVSAAFAPSAAQAESCPHAFMPLRAGTLWIYKVSGAPAGHTLLMRLRVEAVYKEGAAVVADISSQMLDRSGDDEKVLADVRQEYRCDQKGLHTTQPATAVTGPGGERMNLEVTGKSGVTLPPPDTLHPGMTWTEGVTMRMIVPGEQAPVAVKRSARLQLVDDEPIAVTAGSFDAIRVVSEETLAIPGAPTEQHRAEIWYGRGVGMVRTRTAKGTLELVKYSAGK